jgi:hypothetical protein
MPRTVRVSEKEEGRKLKVERRKEKVGKDELESITEITTFYGSMSY